MIRTDQLDDDAKLTSRDDLVVRSRRSTRVHGDLHVYMMLLGFLDVDGEEMESAMRLSRSCPLARLN
jgi:hypothetical protein